MNTPADTTKLFPPTRVVNGKRAVCRIKDNTYRRGVGINYPYRIVYIRFVGTHAEYDKIAVKEA